MRPQVVVGDKAQIREFEVVQINRAAVFDGLFDVVVDDRITLPGAGRSEYDGCTEGIDYVYPSCVQLSLIPETCRQINGVFVRFQTHFLHETLVLLVERVFEQAALHQPRDTQTAGHQTEIPCKERQPIQQCPQGCEQPQAEQRTVAEEQHPSDCKEPQNTSAGNGLLLDTGVHHAGES